MLYPAHQVKPIFFFAIIATLVLVSCKKDKVNNNNSSTTEIAEVKTDGSIRTISLDFTPGSETVTAITLANKGGSGAVHVKLTQDNAAVKAAALMPLPANGHTAPTLEYDVPANGTIAVPIILNRGNLTVDTTYGIGFTITEVSAGTIQADAKSMVVKITLRNRWDGRYKVTGTLVDFSEPTISLPEHEIRLITTSPTKVKMIPKDLGIEGALIKFGINLSFYGDFGPVMTFDPITNKITSVVNFYGQPTANTRAAELDPSGTNLWTAASKNIAIKYWMNQPSVISPHRALFTNTLTYLGPR